MTLIWEHNSERILQADGSVWGVVRKPQGDGVEEVLSGLERVPRLIVRAGFEDLEGPNWLPAARERWARFAAALLAGAAERDSGMRLLVLPDVEAVLSDIPGTLTFLRTMPGFGLLIEPAGLMAESMVSNRMDHLVRIVETLVGHSSCEGVVVGGGMELGEEWDEGVLSAAKAAGKPVVHRRK